ncbi:hypothetical protein CMUST_09460 [Corynebacterium mustelae]|uniref:Uncharacterized protein n=1 Tax=Corynebacterium mustelae TaxID=571915 RepID=A0A0G3H329_9CORY|nr:hypothetical protein [Corynebacterium mustelae]AKK06208.1 hypothetical protein CMUST_09460 [Corynebacterium mustelae]
MVHNAPSSAGGPQSQHEGGYVQVSPPAQPGAVGTTPSLTRTLIRLNGLLWWRSFKANVSSIVVNLLILVYGAFGLIAITAIMGFEMLDGNLGALAGAVGLGATCYVFLAVMMPAGEGQVMPESLATFPVSTRQIMPGLMLIQLLQTRGFLALLCTFVTTVATCIVWSALGFGVLHMIIVVFSMLLSLAIVFSLAESVAILLSNASNTKRKDRKAIIGFVAFFVMWIAYMAVINSSDSRSSLSTYGQYLQWSPLASSAGIVRFAAEGNWLNALACFGITIATLLVTVTVWWRSTNYRLANPLGGQSSTGNQHRGVAAKSAGAGRSLLLPGLAYTPRNMVLSRAVRYIKRDTRQIIALAMLPMMAVYFLVMDWRFGGSTVLLGVVLIAIFSSINAANDFGFDGPANWLHLTSNITAKDLLLGRHWGSVLPTVMASWCFFLLVAVLKPIPETYLIIGIALGLQATSLGVSVFLTVYNPFPTARPGTSPWQDRSGFSAGAFISSFAGIFLAWIPLIPGIGLTIYGYVQGFMWAQVVGVILTISLGLGFYAMMLRVAINRLASHYPEIFAKVRRYV